MKINSMGPSKAIGIYSSNKKVVTNSSNNEKKDSLEISTVGRSLSSLSIDGSTENDPQKIEKIKKEISQGTYTTNGRVIAQKMIDIIKGREI